MRTNPKSYTPAARRPTLAATFATLCMALASGGTHAQQGQPQPGADGVLRVCADPNNLPFSNQKEEGFENRIAALLAKEMGLKLEYTWFPQRMGFIRNTLRAMDKDAGRYKCDLVIGVPDEFELAATTRPYYRSTYAMVFRGDSGLGSVKTPDDLAKVPADTLHKLKLGVFAQTPPVDWLQRHKLFDQAISFNRQSGDPEEYPGQIIERELMGKKIDVAFAWGPIAGYFARKAGGGVSMVPFPAEKEIKFDYAIAMGVRHGNKPWRDRIDGLIAAKQPEINAILREYQVPLLDEAGKPMQAGAASMDVLPGQPQGASRKASWLLDLQAYPLKTRMDRASPGRPV